MSLATRCPSCGTVFRVVSDQLKVSEGWVRCGRCSEVFNAAQRLFELEQDRSIAAPQQQVPAAGAAAPLPQRTAEPASSPPAARVRLALAAPSAPAEVPAAEVAHAEANALAPGASQDGSAATDQAPAESLEGSAPGWRGQAPAGPVAQHAAVPAQEARSEPQGKTSPSPDPETAPLAEHPPASTAEADRASDLVTAATAEATAPGPAEPATPDPTPEFIRRADRAAQKRPPWRRGPLAALSLLLALTLVVQVAAHYRDHLAAGWPGTRPWLQAACRALGCSIEAPRRIESLNVDSSGLVRVQGSPLYRLSLVVQNKASTVVRMPAIDLALTDTQGQTMARRVLTAAELGQPAASLPPGGEVALQATLELGEERVAGYTVELFYP